jgi:hypothetical protein
VKKKIRKLRKEAAAGPDEIGPRVLQELENEISAALVIIFRHSLMFYYRKTYALICN